MTDTLALLLGWEVAKPWRLACADVDRASRVCARTSRRSTECCSAARTALPSNAPRLSGLVSNIASWNHPMSARQGRVGRRRGVGARCDRGR